MALQLDDQILHDVLGLLGRHAPRQEIAQQCRAMLEERHPQQAARIVPIDLVHL
jgi:hypothetical protein